MPRFNAGLELRLLLSTLALAALVGWATPAGARPLIRGDANTDGDADLSDGVRILLYLFTDRVTLDCADAADVTDSGEIALDDAVSLFMYLFLGGPAPLPPFPDCGEDPTADALGCEAFEPCPVELDAPVIVCPAGPVKTSDDTPGFSGTGEPSTTVLILEGDAVLARAAVDAGGEWSATIGSPRSEGVHSYSARVEDALGNVSPESAPVTVTVDTTAPAAPVDLAIVTGSNGNHLRWTANEEEDLRGYEVWRKVRGQSDDEYRKLNLVVIAEPELRDQAGDENLDPELGPPAPGVSYCYRVQAVDDAAPISCDE